MLVQLFYLLPLIDLGWCAGTPANMEQIFRNSCGDVLFNVNDCNAKWTAFTEAVCRRNPANVQPADYDDFIGNNVNPLQIPVLLYTGTSAIAKRIDEQAAYTSFRMTAVKIVDRFRANNNNNNVYWCGREGNQGDGFDHDQQADCANTNAYKSFWGSVSVNIARSVVGNRVFWLASGNRPGGAFENDVYFSTHELPSLPQEVDELIVIVLCNDEQGSQRCNDVIQEMTPLRNRVIENDNPIQQVWCYNLRAVRNGNGWNQPYQVAARVADIVTRVANGQNVAINEECNAP